jgi:hypothetical protein
MVEQTILATKSERKQTGAIRVSLMNGVPPRWYVKCQVIFFY